VGVQTQVLPRQAALWCRAKCTVSSSRLMQFARRFWSSSGPCSVKKHHNIYSLNTLQQRC
jgi:hypothetical protein